MNEVLHAISSISELFRKFSKHNEIEMDVIISLEIVVTSCYWI